LHDSLVELRIIFGEVLQECCVAQDRVSPVNIVREFRTACR
jgi:hypothetical protein